MDIGLTTLDEDDIARHLPSAQSLVTQCSVMEASSGKSKTALAGTRRRFVSTVSTAGVRSARKVELEKTLSSIKANRQCQQRLQQI